jgi:hypothetical protein
MGHDMIQVILVVVGVSRLGLVDVGVAVTVAVNIVRGCQIRRCLSGVRIAPRAEVIVSRLSVSVRPPGKVDRSGGSQAGVLQRSLNGFDVPRSSTQ